MKQRLFILFTVLVLLFPSAGRANSNGTFSDASVFQGNELINLERFRQIVEAALSRFEMQGTLAGFKVVDLNTGLIIYDFNGNVLFNPASNMKIVTTSAALYGLGPGYRFTTSIRTETPPDTRGTVRGDLYVIGRGDPLLNHENLQRLAADLYRSGLRTVRGDIVVDDSFFDAARQIPGWDNDNDQSCYCAPMGALSVQFNTVWVAVQASPKAGRRVLVGLTPQSDYFRIRNSATTVRKGRAKLTVKILPGTQHPQLIIQGRLNRRDGSVTACRKVADPAAYAGWTLRRYLTAQGIRIRGKVKVRKADGLAKNEILNFYSPTLEELIYHLNKESNNFMAEQIFRTVGAEKKGAPGSWENGSGFTGEFLSQVVGVKEGSYEIQNGSGLGMDNRLSPDALIRVLQYMYTNPALKNAFLASLPVMGLDGTLRNRHKNSDASNRIIAKTGLLNNVMTLSGYVETKGCDRLAFSLLLNRIAMEPKTPLRKIQDEIILAMSNLVLNPANQSCPALRPAAQ